MYPESPPSPTPISNLATPQHHPKLDAPWRDPPIIIIHHPPFPSGASVPKSNMTAISSATPTLATTYGAIRTATFTTTIIAPTNTLSVFIYYPTITQSSQFTTVILGSAGSKSAATLPILVLTEVVGVIVSTDGQPLNTATLIQTAPPVLIYSGNGEASKLDLGCAAWGCWSTGQKAGTIIAIVIGIAIIGILIWALCRRRRAWISRGRPKPRTTDVERGMGKRNTPVGAVMSGARLDGAGAKKEERYKMRNIPRSASLTSSTSRTSSPSSVSRRRSRRRSTGATPRQCASPQAESHRVPRASPRSYPTTAPMASSGQISSTQRPFGPQNAQMPPVPPHSSNIRTALRSKSRPQSFYSSDDKAGSTGTKKHRYFPQTSIVRQLGDVIQPKSRAIGVQEWKLCSSDPAPRSSRHVAPQERRPSTGRETQSRGKRAMSASYERTKYSDPEIVDERAARGRSPTEQETPQRRRSTRPAAKRQCRPSSGIP
ncbi:uncharacterized protein BP5553_07522 [Venustampulla echinocandica]|uniref:Uncharacterized protein n=1 Tax=Venustampulla echinocandica TaxID=2656787 RepID=A0A370TGS4_9HELO|nr:uncharacterized protein BP5553_07522 [Venustampulla echinocandica]RDL34394.1 hypothetical protein BP5553_07522 [Venustampulla echinocandica]